MKRLTWKLINKIGDQVRLGELITLDINTKFHDSSSGALPCDISYSGKVDTGGKISDISGKISCSGITIDVTYKKADQILTELWSHYTARDVKIKIPKKI
jgi:hypothetical protein